MDTTREALSHLPPKFFGIEGRLQLPTPVYIEYPRCSQEVRSLKADAYRFFGLEIASAARANMILVSKIPDTITLSIVRGDLIMYQEEEKIIEIINTLAYVYANSMEQTKLLLDRYKCAYY